MGKFDTDTDFLLTHAHMAIQRLDNKIKRNLKRKLNRNTAPKTKWQTRNNALTFAPTKQFNDTLDGANSVVMKPLRMTAGDSPLREEGAIPANK